MSSRIKLDVDSQILHVVLAFPERLNALDTPACEALHEAWERLERDPDLRVAILSGEGRAFCAGHDLKANPEIPLPPSGFGGITKRRNRTKPIIAAAHGFALGGGLEMLLACDILIAEESTQFALPEMRYGAAALAGGVQRLASRLPAAIAMDILLTGRRFDAQEAYRWGMLSRLTPAGGALAAARETAGLILSNAPLGVQYTLRSAREVLEGSEAMIDTIERQMRDYLSVLEHSADNREGIAAFVEKREPVWRGR